MGKKAGIMVRINPNIDAHTHKYITTGLEENKFGISEHEFDALIGLLGRCRWIDFKGLHFHIGSQILDVHDVFSLECRRACEIVSYFEERGLKVLLTGILCRISGCGSKPLPKACASVGADAFP